VLLAPSGSGRLIFMVVIEQVCHTAELFCRSLQSLEPAAAALSPGSAAAGGGSG